MAFQLRRGLDAERLRVRFAQGEIVFATDTKKLYVGDGETLGGIEVSLSPDTVDKLEGIANLALDSAEVISVTNQAISEAGVSVAQISSLIQSTVDASYVQSRQTRDALTFRGNSQQYFLNFNNLSNQPAIQDSSQVEAIVRAVGFDDSSEVIRIISDYDTHDSAKVIVQIVETVNQAFIDQLDTHDSAKVIVQIADTVNQSFIDQFDTHDSAKVIVQIADTVNQSFIDQFDTHDSAAVLGQINATVNQSFIDQFDTHDSAAVSGQIDSKLATDITLGGNLNVGGYIGGPSVFTIDPAAIGDSTGKVVILGDLQIDGLFTRIKSTTVTISDKNIVLADSATDASQANGAGITVNGADATIQYASTGNKWEFNKPLYYFDNRILTTADDLHDSAAVQGQIDSAVNQTLVQSFIDQSFINTFDTHDSAAVLGQINATVDQSFIDQFDTHDSAAVLGQINATVNQSFIDQFDTHDSAAVQGQISATVTKGFVDALNVNADTLDGQEGSYYLDYGNFTSLPNILDSDHVTAIADYRIGVNGFDSIEAYNIALTAIAATDLHDSAAVQQQITSTITSSYIQSRQTTYDFATDTQPFVDAAYVEARRPAEAILTVENDSSGHYKFVGDGFPTITSGSPTLYLHRGMEYKFTISASGHPFYIKTADVGGTGSQYTNGVTNNGTQLGTLTFEVPMDAPEKLYYVCQYHSGMTGEIIIDRNIGLDSAAVLALTAHDTHDSAAVQKQIDSNLTQALIDTFDTHDSAAVQAQIDSNFTQAKIDTFDTHDSALVLGQINATVNQSFIDQFDTHDSTAVTGQITGTVDAAYVQARQITYDFLDSAEAVALIDSAHVRGKIDQAFINTFDTHDSAAVSGQIDAKFASDATFSKDLTIDSNLIVSGAVNTVGAIATETAFNINVINSNDTRNAIRFVTGDPSSIAIGDSALQSWSLTNASWNNIAIGRRALQSLDGHGGTNLAIGTDAQRYATGFYNIAIGRSSLRDTTSNRNVAVGDFASGLSNGQHNVAMGYSAFYNTGTSQRSTAIGNYSMSGATGPYNTALGYASLENASGDLNVALGYFAGNDITTGLRNTIIGSYALDGATTAAHNVVVGSSAMGDGAAGNYNTAVGRLAGRNIASSYNTVIGAQAGDQITTGSNLTVIGYNAAASSATATNEITLGNTNVDTLRVPGAGFDVASGTGTFTGNVIAATPTADNHLATKAYVDASHDSGLVSNQIIAEAKTTIDSAYLRSAFSGGTGVTYNTGTGEFAIGQPVATTDSVTFATLTVTDLNVIGTQTVTSTASLSVSDPFIHLAEGNDSNDLVDIGFVGHYYDGSTIRHTGLVRDASTGSYILFTNLDDSTLDGDSSIRPSAINTTGPGYTLANLGVGTVTGNLTGNVTGTVSDISNHNTGSLSEGSNLYYTKARVDSDIDNRVTTSFVNNLSVDYTSLSNLPFILDSNNVQSIVNATDLHDSAAVQGQIDATIAATDTHDSAAVLGQINATVNQSFIDQFDTHDSAAVLAQINARVTQSFIDTFDTHDSAAVQGQIDATIAATDTHDSAAVLAQINATVNQTFIDAFDTHDSALVLGQINGVVDALDLHDSGLVVAQINDTVDQTFINNLNVDASTLGGQSGSYYLNYNNFTNTPNVLDSADVTLLVGSATHDSAKVQGQIDSSTTGYLTEEEITALVIALG